MKLRNRVVKKENETIFERYPATSEDFSPAENLMIAVYDQAITDYKQLYMSGKTEVNSNNHHFSLADIEEFMEKTPVNDYMRIDGHNLLESLKTVCEEELGKRQELEEELVSDSYILE